MPIPGTIEKDRDKLHSLTSAYPFRPRTSVENFNGANLHSDDIGINSNNSALDRLVNGDMKLGRNGDDGDMKLGRDGDDGDMKLGRDGDDLSSILKHLSGSSDNNAKSNFTRPNINTHSSHSFNTLSNSTLFIDDKKIDFASDDVYENNNNPDDNSGFQDDTGFHSCESGEVNKFNRPSLDGDEHRKNGFSGQDHPVNGHFKGYSNTDSEFSNPRNSIYMTGLTKDHASNESDDFTKNGFYESDDLKYDNHDGNEGTKNLSYTSYNDEDNSMDFDYQSLKNSTSKSFGTFKNEDEIYINDISENNSRTNKSNELLNKNGKSNTEHSDISITKVSGLLGFSDQKSGANAFDSSDTILDGKRNGEDVNLSSQDLPDPDISQNDQKLKNPNLSRFSSPISNNQGRNIQNSVLLSNFNSPSSITLNISSPGLHFKDDDYFTSKKEKSKISDFKDDTDPLTPTEITPMMTTTTTFKPSSNFRRHTTPNFGQNQNPKIQPKKEEDTPLKSNTSNLSSSPKKLISRYSYSHPSTASHTDDGNRQRSSLLKRKKKRFSYDDQVVIGNKISEGHTNFVMAYNMLTGIRVAVSRCSGLMKKITDEDYKVTKKLHFNFDGSELTPSSKYDFKFKDYAPEVFRDLRKQFGLDPADYLVSVTGKYILSELGSPGKSGSFFYYSRDYRFIIKTIHHAEHKQLRRILRNYHEHIKDNPNTLISQFYGLHRVKMPLKNGSKKVHFVVMNNLFPPHRDIHLKYDLKGSTWGRITKIDKDSDLSSLTLKDLNWLDRQDKIKLGPEKRKLFLEQLESDVKLLKKINVMDYSLLLGVHDVKRGNTDEMKLSVFDPISNTKSDVVKTNPRELDRGVDLPTQGFPGRTKFIFYGHDGGLRATDEDNRPLSQIYYLGIIDCLTNYGFKKRVETFFRSLRHPRETVSAIPAGEYGDRFLRFIKAGSGQGKSKVQ